MGWVWIVLALPIAVLFVVAVYSDWRAAKHGWHLRSPRDMSWDAMNHRNDVEAPAVGSGLFGALRVWVSYRRWGQEARSNGGS